jgi:predicted nucleic acid-binding protein
MVISNSSPLIHLTRLGKIEFLIDLVGSINIPKAVFEEVITEGKKKNYSEAFIIENYIKKEKINVLNVGQFDAGVYPPLGKGELEAIELAKQEKDLLIIDDQKCRQLATILQIDYQTTLSTMFDLLLTKKIDISEYRANIKKFARNSWISADIVQEYIEKGEKYGR